MCCIFTTDSMLIFLFFYELTYYVVIICYFKTNNMKIFYKLLKIIVSTILLGILLNSCKDGKLIGGDARKFPDDPKLRVKKNLEEGRGFRLNDSTKILGGGGTFDFASSNELWRASLDVIDFMPLSSVNYSGGIIITDWYSDGEVLMKVSKYQLDFY